MNKVALITGSSKGIGKAIAIRLAKEGMNITINYSKSEKNAKETKKEIEELGVQCLLFKTSVDDKVLTQKMIDKTIEKFSRLDVLVNNAGTTNFVAHKDLDGMKEEYWDKAFSVNTKSIFFISKIAYIHLKNVNGSIVNITSDAGLTGLGSSIAYAASKAAANSITKSLARVMAPEVRVNSLAPGVVKTDWYKGNKDHIGHSIEGIPMGRIATPEDVAESAFSLINHSPFVTGEIIKVDGGANI